MKIIYYITGLAIIVIVVVGVYLVRQGACGKTSSISSRGDIKATALSQSAVKVEQPGNINNKKVEELSKDAAPTAVESDDGKLSPEEISAKMSALMEKMYLEAIGPKYLPVDVSDISDPRGKIDKILARLSDPDDNSHFPNNPLVKQIVQLGEVAIQPLLELLEKEKTRTDRVPQREEAITEALNLLLTDKNKDVILKYFAEDDLFIDLVKRYQFPEAEDIVMNKISAAYNGKAYKNGMTMLSIVENLIDLALMMDQTRAIPLLVDYLKTRKGRAVVYAAKRLAMVPGLDITEALRQAVKNNTISPGFHATIVEFSAGHPVWVGDVLVDLADPMLDCGMPEGLDIILKELREGTEKGSPNKYECKMMCEIVVKHTGFLGNPDEVAAWLAENKGNLVWNPTTRKFELASSNAGQ